MGLLRSEYISFERNGKLLFIFPDVPYWMVVNNNVGNLIHLLAEFNDLESIIQNYLNRFGGVECEIANTVNNLYLRFANHCVLDGIQHVKEEWKGSIESAGINLTSSCNLRCSYCYYDAGDNTRQDVLEFDDIKKYLDGVKEFANDSCFIQFTGGEPLLKKDLLFKSIEYARKIELPKITVNTNGILVDDSVGEFLKDYHVDNVTISLDGTSSSIHDEFRGKGSFEKAKQAISTLKKYDLRITASMTVHGDNFGELKDFLTFGRKENISVFTSPLFPSGRAQRSNDLKHVPLDQLYRELAEWYSDGLFNDIDLNGTFFQTIILPLRDLTRRRYCGAAMSTVFLDVDCNVYPCANTAGLAYFRGGNIRENSFRTIWLESENFTRTRQAISVDKMNPCRDCFVRYICGGFCRGVTYKVTNDINSPFIWCGEIKKAIIEGMWTIGDHPNVYCGIKNKFANRDMLNQSI